MSSGYSGASGGYFILDNGWTGTTPGTNYFQFSITPASASVSLTSISFGYRESGTSTGPTNFYFRSSADAYAADLATGSLTNSDNNWHSSGSSSVTITFVSATTFRIYANGATNGTPTLRLDDLTINGAVVAVPEPATVAVWLGLGAMGAALGWRRFFRARPKGSIVVLPRGQSKSLRTTSAWDSDWAQGAAGRFAFFAAGGLVGGDHAAGLGFATVSGAGSA
ncbi:MAG: PEP-CTERM sorting domain-containing protein [Opitutus sp.]|nr:PEP-CTERM sorting domain-containing protein [Opitutus sp.]